MTLEFFSFIPLRCSMYALCFREEFCELSDLHRTHPQTFLKWMELKNSCTTFSWWKYFLVKLIGWPGKALIAARWWTNVVGEPANRSDEQYAQAVTSLVGCVKSYLQIFIPSFRFDVRKSFTVSIACSSQDASRYEILVFCLYRCRDFVHVTA